MSDDFEQQDWVRVGVAAALRRQYAADADGFLANLAEMLQKVLPGATSVEFRRVLFGPKTIYRITVELQDARYTLTRDPHRVPVAERVMVVRGIALKSEQIAVEDWVTAVSDGLEAEARSSAAARDALARLAG